LSATSWVGRQGVAIWRRRTSKALVYLVLLVITVIMLYPFWLMAQMSFRSLSQYYLGKGFSLTTWHDLFAALPVGREMLNSTLITLSSIAVYSALGAPFATFLMATYFRRLPEDVIEAALIDGLGYGTVFFRIMLPLAVPAIVTVAVLQFIQIWDDLLVGLLFLQTPAHRTITVGLETIPAQHFQNFPMEMAGSLVSALPAVVVYLLFQRYLIRGLTMGMSK